MKYINTINSLEGWCTEDKIIKLYNLIIYLNMDRMKNVKAKQVTDNMLHTKLVISSAFEYCKIQIKRNFHRNGLDLISFEQNS